MVLGDMGAQVIKIEQPFKGDDTRSWGPPFAPNTVNKENVTPESAYFLGVNRNKLSVTLNLKHPKGVEIVKSLAKISDVLIENYIPGKLEKLGLGYDILSKINPKLIYTSITGYGPTGPYCHHAGYDVIIEAEAGFMHITGEPEGKPVKVGVAVTDISTGLYAHGAILGALYARTQTGLGQKIDVSLLESQVANLANIGSNYLIAGLEAQRHGTSHPSIVPYENFKTSNGYICIGAGNDKLFQKLCHALEMPELALNEKFKTNAARVANRKELTSLLNEILKQKTTNDWIEILKPTGIPFGPLNNIQQTFEHPQVKHRQMIVNVNHPTAGNIQLTGPPVKYSRNPSTVRMPPPLLGQHTHQVLEQLCGLTRQEFEQLKEENVI